MDVAETDVFRRIVHARAGQPRPSFGRRNHVEHSPRTRGPTASLPIGRAAVPSRRSCAVQAACSKLSLPRCRAVGNARFAAISHTRSGICPYRRRSPSCQDVLSARRTPGGVASVVQFKHEAAPPNPNRRRAGSPPRPCGRPARRRPVPLRASAAGGRRRTAFPGSGDGRGLAHLRRGRKQGRCGGAGVGGAAVVLLSSAPRIFRMRHRLVRGQSQARWAYVGRCSRRPQEAGATWWLGPVCGRETRRDREASPPPAIRARGATGPK